MSPTVELTGTQKVAVVLMQMDRANAAAVMRQFSEEEAGEIAAELVRLRRVDSEVAEQALSEIYELTSTGKAGTRGGKDFAAGLLEASFGSEKATSVLDRIASTNAGRSFEFLATAEATQLVSLLDGELPQTIALVIAHLPPDVGSAVMAGFESELRTAVARALATMGNASPEYVKIVAEALKSRAGSMVGPREEADVVGGIQPLVDIINRSDVAMERDLLESLDANDPELAEEVRSRMLTFADLVKFERRDVQRVLRGIDPKALALAMKGAAAPVVETIRANISDRTQEILKGEIEAMGKVRVSQVEQARADIVRSIRELEAQGEITVQRGDDDDYVV
ncbi:flagellar motor switch protein FliG [Arthrobacter sp. JSM 101049]|uniref:flagellar motor switch protein FliG n=1 Tax=Arthrobacter sp. JSM 101049 TaxID=929097 RepID=UPI0035643FAB